MNRNRAPWWRSAPFAVSLGVHIALVGGVLAYLLRKPHATPPVAVRLTMVGPDHGRAVSSGRSGTPEARRESAQNDDKATPAPLPPLPRRQVQVQAKAGPATRPPVRDHSPSVTPPPKPAKAPAKVDAQASTEPAAVKSASKPAKTQTKSASQEDGDRTSSHAKGGARDSALLHSLAAKLAHGPKAAGSARGNGGFGDSDAPPSGHNGTATVESDGTFDDAGYLGNVQRQIQRLFRPPAGSRRSATVRFALGRDGHLLSVEVSRRSGDPTFDLAALSAVELAGRRAVFGPLPHAYSGERLTVSLDLAPSR